MEKIRCIIPNIVGFEKVPMKNWFCKYGEPWKVELILMMNKCHFFTLNPIIGNGITNQNLYTTFKIITTPSEEWRAVRDLDEAVDWLLENKVIDKELFIKNNLKLIE